MQVEPTSEKDWEGQDDAYTLARAEEIRADETRMKNAAKWAGKIAEEKQIEADNLKKLSQLYPNTVKAKEEA